MSTTNTFPLSAQCVNEEFRFHLFRRGVLNFLRGIAAALLMPLEMLECLRCGNCADRSIALSWALSAVMYTGVFEIWNLSNKAIFDGHDRTGSVLVYCLVVLVAGIWSGSIQTDRSSKMMDASSNSYRKHHGSHKHGGGHHGSHPGHDHGRHHHGGHDHGPLHDPQFQYPTIQDVESRSSIESRSRTESGSKTESRSTATLQSAASPQMTSAKGVCCHNCRMCRESICIKTGMAKRGRSL